MTFRPRTISPQSARTQLRWLVAFCFWLPAAPLFALPADDRMPVIEAGRESDVMALIAPWKMGEEIVPDWTLAGGAIEPTRIRFDVRNAAGETRSLTLEYPGRVGAAAESTKSFALARAPADAPPLDPDPLTALADAIRRNDVKQFWPAAPPSSNEQPFWRWSLRDILTDGIVIVAVSVGFVLVHLRRTLRRDPAWIAPALMAITALAGVLRVVFSRQNLMEAWAYQRLAPFAQRIYDGVVLKEINAVLGGSYFLDDVVFNSNLILATLTPMVVYAHGRYILKDYRSALAAAALIALLPEHLRFSHSDVYMIQSLATSSLTFVMLYTALTDPSRVWRAISFVILPLLCTATYFVRPENFIFVLLDLGAIYICTRDIGFFSPRSLLAIACVVGTSAVAFVFNLLTNYSASLAHGLSFETLSNAAKIFFDAQLNTLVNPWITPPGVTVLALLGAVTLWRRGEQQRSIFLVVWLLGFFVVHSFVVPYHPAMQARYHMNLITPLVMLSAAAAPAVLSWPRPLGVALAVYLLASPILHRDFVTDTNFNEMREFAFLTSLRDRIPPDCTILEYRGAPGRADLSNQFASRVERVAKRLASGEPGLNWRVVSAASVEESGASESLSTPARQALQDPPTCLVFYEGLTCFSLRNRDEQRAAICQQIRDQFDGEPIATVTFESRIYDPVNAGYLLLNANGRSYSDMMVPEGSPVTLTAFRARD